MLGRARLFVTVRDSQGEAEEVVPTCCRSPAGVGPLPWGGEVTGSLSPQVTLPLLPTSWGALRFPPGVPTPLWGLSMCFLTVLSRLFSFRVCPCSLVLLPVPILVSLDTISDNCRLSGFTLHLFLHSVGQHSGAGMGSLFFLASGSLCLDAFSVFQANSSCLSPLAP